MGLARQRLLAGDAAPLLRPQVHRLGAPADRSGMMCSGEQEVLLWPLSPADLPAVAAIETALGALGSGAFELSGAGGLRVLAGAPAAFYDYRPGPQWRYCQRLGFRD